MSAADAAPSAGPVPDLGRADQVRVVATVRRIPDFEASTAVVVTLDVPPDERLDERPLLDLVAGTAAATGPATLWTLDVAHAFVGAGGQTREARTDVRLDLVVPTSGAATVRADVETLAAAVQRLTPTRPRALPRDEAVARARDLVGLVWGVPAPELGVSDEEHHADPPGWTVGLVDGQGVRFDVVLGAVAGDPHVARLRRLHAAEVADSVGESG